MHKRHERYRRLEPHPRDRELTRGFRAEVHDPAWFLGRQWQLGEHQGENAASPVRVHYEISESPVLPPAGDARFDPRQVPAEVIVESEPDDWWTMGRRIRLGANVAAAVDIESLTPTPEDFQFKEPPPPYEKFARHYDGRRLWRERHSLGINDGDFGTELPPIDAVDMWDYSELVYTAGFQCAGGQLRLPRHGGGHIDWYAVDADPGQPPKLENEPVRSESAYPAPLEYPGAPHPRWWQIEDGPVDIGGYPPDRSHFATTLLIDLIAGHSDDWFLFPIMTQVGHAVHLHQVTIEDIFGEKYPVASPPLPPQPDGWSLFQTAGLPAGALVLWATVMTPLQGEVVERVLVGTDEYANLLWAVEQRLDGRELVPPENGAGQNPPPDTVDISGAKSFRYVAGKNAAPYWHPYPIREENNRRRFVQGKLVDLSGPTPQLMPDPESQLLIDPQAVSPDPVHQIEPATIPVAGISLERRWVLARDTSGNPALWIQRQRQPLLSPPARLLRFDVLEETIA